MEMVKIEIKEEKSSDDFDPARDSNWLWTGDNLAVMMGLDDEIIDMIYLDPPFNSNENYINVFKTVDQEIEMQFKDIWNPSENDELLLEMIGDRFPQIPDYINSVEGIFDDGMRAYLIFMGIRLIEMHRILKKSGSIYLHCDSTASHYLKSLMDGIFGKQNFIQDIIWYRYNKIPDKRVTWRKYHDNILCYRKSIATELVNVIQDTGEMVRRKKMKKIDGRIQNLEEYTVYEKQKVLTESVLTIPDINQGNSREKVGYPTQKPIELLRRIIEASTQTGDLVFDPFAGCATTVIAASRLSRRWICCDIAQSSVPILKKRIKEDYPSDHPQLVSEKGIGFITNVTNPGDIPSKRLKKQVRNSKKLKLFLASKALDTDQIEYKCNGCGISIPIRLLEIDHLNPKAKGGDDSEKNRILLCSNCNRVKGGRTWKEWKGVEFPRGNEVR